VDPLDRSVSCEICQETATRWATINGHVHFRCPNCRHLFVYPRPSQETLDVFYRDGSFYDSAERQETRLQVEAAQRVGLLSELCKQPDLPMRLLDVGCASGYFLAAAEEAGWDAHGVERSEYVANRARDRYRARIHVGVFEKLIVPGAPFPVVTAWEVLEHAIDSVVFFRALVCNLAPGGLLAISTPLSDGVPARVMGRQFPMLTPPEHLSLFSRKSLNLLAAKNNLRELHFSSFSNLDGQSLSSGLSRLFFNQNIASLGNVTRVLLGTVAYGLVWMPRIIDRLGMGSEMLVVFQKNHQ